MVRENQLATRAAWPTGAARPVRSSGWGMVEVMVAVLVGAVLSLPILWMFTSARRETGQAINYLRALELAHETMEWIAATPLTAQTIAGLTATRGPLGPGGAGVPDPVGTNGRWEPHLAKTLAVPEQYRNCYFFRQIGIEPVSAAGGDHGAFLQRVTVTIAWNENLVPPDVNLFDRRKKVVLTSLVCDERRGY